MEIIATDQSAPAIGPYSQAVKAVGFLYCSGQIALKRDGNMVDGDCAAQCEQIMQNIGAILKAAGSDFTSVLKTTIFLTDINDFSKVNEIYGRFFSEHKPARSTVAVAALPKGANVEIECIAFVGQDKL